jgi:aldehyde:ferredoxin oxidoreductase
MGKILWIDLTRRKTWVEEPGEAFYRKYIGTYGTGGKILYDYVEPWVDAFDPLNLLIFSTGPVTGTITQTAGRHTMIGKSPLSGYFGDASCGGFWGPELKFAGYDMIVVTGRAQEPVYVWINDGDVEIRPGRAYWGMDARAVDRALKRDLGDKRAQVCCIGPAGENLVRFAAVMHDDAGRAAGRLGLGAVMGYKRLKAVVVRGHKKVPVADEDRLKELMKDIAKYYATNEAVRNFHDGGTSGYFLTGYEIGDTPAFNWNDREFGPYNPEKIGYPGEFEKILAGRRSCYTCGIACRRVSGSGPEGVYHIEDQVEGAEYENMSMLGSDCGIEDVYALNKANDLCNLYGLDTISTGATIAFAMECYERGIISKEDTDWIELKFGNSDALLAMIDKIARREGFGDILAEGARRAAKIIGNGAEKYAIHVKGVEIAAHDPRAFQGGGPHYATTVTGGRHTEGIPIGVEVFEPWPEFGYTEIQDRFSTKGKGRLAKLVQDWWCFINLGGWCLFAADSPRYMGQFKKYVEVFTAVTGMPVTLQDALHIGERIFNLRKAFNMRHGCTRAEDTLPERLLKEPNPRAQNAVVKLDEMLPEYYRERGWDPKTSKPTPEKLKELGLEELIPDLWPEKA